MILKHYLTGSEKNVPEGFSMTTFLFGFWVPLLRGDIARGILFFVIGQIAFSPFYYGLMVMSFKPIFIGMILIIIYGFITGSIYNDMYIEFLKEKGYITDREYRLKKNEKTVSNISKNEKRETEYKAININIENQDTILMICYPEIKELIKNVNLAEQDSMKDFIYNINKISDKINSRNGNEKEKLLLKEELKKIVEISGLKSSNFKEIADKDYFEKVKDKVDSINTNESNKDIIIKLEELYKKIDRYNQLNSVSGLKKLVLLYRIENLEEPKTTEILKSIERKEIKEYIEGNKKNKNEIIEELLKNKNKAIEYREAEYKYNIEVEKYQKNKEAEIENKEIENKNNQILKENEEYISKLQEMRSSIEKEIEELGMQNYFKVADVIKSKNAQECDYQYVSKVTRDFSIEEFVSRREANKITAIWIGVILIFLLALLGTSVLNKYSEYQDYVTVKESRDIEKLSSFIKKYPDSKYLEILLEKERYVEGNGNIKDFIIGRYEVTQAEYESVMGYNPSYFKGKNLPVESVTWYDAVMYCNKLSEKENLPKYYNITNIEKDGNYIVKAEVTIIGGQGYRLPTDEEWEYAAKGGNKSKGYKYSGSNDIDDVAWYSGNSGATTHPVGQKKSNELGLYDMNGNVSEWTETLLNEDYYNRYFNQMSWSAFEDCFERIKSNIYILAGGSLSDLAYLCDFENRGFNYAGGGFSDRGFRVCRSSS